MPHQLSDAWPPVRLVEDVRALDQALARWSAAPAIGVDTEANSFHAYRERLCLLQVADGENEWLVDPIALGPELRRIAPLFADPRITKIFHAAEYDLMLLRKELAVEVRGLFDTQVAITLLKHKQTGLAAVLQEIYGLDLSKKEQRSNWGRRPLTAEQMAYARADVRFLPDLRARLAAELESGGLARHAAHEFERLEREVLVPRPQDPERWRKLKGARELAPEGLARLEALFHWRERAAEARDVPPFRVMGNEALLILAAHPPRDARDLAAVPGIGWNVARKLGDEVMAALGAAAGKRVEMAVVPRLSPADRRRRQIQRENLEALRQWRKEQAIALDLPSERLLHRRQLEDLARALPRSPVDLEKILSLNDWQRENLQGSLLQVLQSLPDPG